MISVLSAGPLTTVQDGGRFGWAHAGVPAAGPADAVAHTLANRLAGNADDAAALECTLIGPRLRFEQDATIALVGGRLQIDDRAADSARSVVIRAGQTVRVGPAQRVRSYLAVGGGIDVPPVLGSRSADTLSGLGPPRLADGDSLRFGSGTGRKALSAKEIAYDGELRVISGPHAEWFVSALPASGYAVDPRSDRVGIRLAGPPLERARTGELPTQGMVTGAIQVPPEGTPIVLLPNHGVTGGYPVVAVVISADLHKLGQLRPGAAVTFTSVDRAAAAAAYRELRASVDSAITEDPAGSDTRDA